MESRDYDVVLFGASGFTGAQTVAYFAANAPSTLRWAMAGRHRAKLEAVKSHSGAHSVDVLVGDSLDQKAMDAIVSRTRVLLTTAGPFAKYGHALVDACVRYKTHYVDITGETVWVKSLIDRYQIQAEQEGTRIIPFCGFDSIPSDLGAYLLVRHIQNQGMSCAATKGFFQMQGGVNGGTLATAYHLYESGQAALARQPFLLNPTQPSALRIQQNQDSNSPHYDSDAQTWVGPFVMAPINTRVVRRSEALFAQWQQSYGPGFSYREYQKFDRGLGWLPASGMTIGTALFELALQSPLRSLVKSALPQPGQGPSEKTMNEGWFRFEILGRTSTGELMRAQISDRGDPGNRVTVKFLCESALCLALDSDQLPGGSTRGGILTPATGLGEILAQRLRQAGMQIEVGSSL